MTSEPQKTKIPTSSTTKKATSPTSKKTPSAKSSKIKTKNATATPSSKKKSDRKKKLSTSKKSPTGSGISSNNSSTAALYSAARLQYQKLLERRDAALNDPAWLSSEPTPLLCFGHDIKLSGSNGSDLVNVREGRNSTAAIGMESPSFLEQDVEIVHRALLHNGLSLDDVTIEAFDTLLEEARKFAMEIMTDAADCAMYSHGNDMITPADLLLAKEIQAEEDIHGSCFALENIQELSRTANEINQTALPIVPDNCYNGIVLPDDLECTLLNRSFDVVCRRKDNVDVNRGSSSSIMNDASSSSSNPMTGNSKDDIQNYPSMQGGKHEKRIPSYGAKQGSKQMQILLKSQAQAQAQTNESSSKPSISSSRSSSFHKSGSSEVVETTTASAVATSMVTQVVAATESPSVSTIVHSPNGQDNKATTTTTTITTNKTTFDACNSTAATATATSTTMGDSTNKVVPASAPASEPVSGQMMELLPDAADLMDLS